MFGLGNEDSTEPMDSTGSSQVLNAASYVLSSQIGEKVNVTVHISSNKGIIKSNLVFTLPIILIQFFILRKEESMLPHKYQSFLDMVSIGD